MKMASFSGPCKLKTVKVSSLTDQSKNWKICVRVTQKSEKKTAKKKSGANVGQNYVYFKVILQDVNDRAEKIEALVYGEKAMDNFYDKLENNKVYFISNGKLSRVKPEFPGVGHAYQINLNMKTDVIPDIDKQSVRNQRRNGTRAYSGDGDAIKTNDGAKPIASEQRHDIAGRVTGVWKLEKKPFHRVRKINVTTRDNTDIMIYLLNKKAQDFDVKCIESEILLKNLQMKGNVILRDFNTSIIDWCKQSYDKQGLAKFMPDSQYSQIHVLDDPTDDFNTTIDLILTNILEQCCSGSLDTYWINHKLCWAGWYYDKAKYKTTRATEICYNHSVCEKESEDELPDISNQIDKVDGSSTVKHAYAESDKSSLSENGDDDDADDLVTQPLRTPSKRRKVQGMKSWSDDKILRRRTTSNTKTDTKGKIKNTLGVKVTRSTGGKIHKHRAVLGAKKASAIHLGGLEKENRKTLNPKRSLFTALTGNNDLEDAEMVADNSDNDDDSDNDDEKKHHTGTGIIGEYQPLVNMTGVDEKANEQGVYSMTDPIACDQEEVVIDDEEPIRPPLSAKKTKRVESSDSEDSDSAATASYTISPSKLTPGSSEKRSYVTDDSDSDNDEDGDSCSKTSDRKKFKRIKKLKDSQDTEQSQDLDIDDVIYISGKDDSESESQGSGSDYTESSESDTSLSHNNDESDNWESRDRREIKRLKEIRKDDDGTKKLLFSYITKIAAQAGGQICEGEELECVIKDAQKLEGRLEVARNICDSQAWNSDFRADIKTYPEFVKDISHDEITPGDITKVEKCQVCNREDHPWRYIVELKGDKYNKNSFEKEEEDDRNADSDDDDNCIEDLPDVRYFMGCFCYERTKLFHKLYHFGYHLYQECKAMIEDGKSIDDIVTDLSFREKMFEKLTNWLDETEKDYTEDGRRANSKWIREYNGP